jgi:hypothetical protein
LDIHVGAELGFHAREWDDDLELVIIQRFDAHYDVCPSIGRLLDCTQKRRYSRSAPQFPDEALMA